MSNPAQAARFNPAPEEAARVIPARELENEINPPNPKGGEREKLLNEIAKDRAMGATPVQLATKYGVQLSTIEKLIRQKEFAIRLQSWIEDLRVPTRQIIAQQGRDALSKRGVMIHDDSLDPKVLDSVTRHQVEMAEGKPIQAIETRNFNFDMKRADTIEAEILDVDRQIAELEGPIAPAKPA
jgi:hypothetical protein